MKKNILTALFLSACVAVVTISAQTPTSENKNVSPAEYENLRRSGQAGYSEDKNKALTRNKARLESAKMQIAPRAEVENQHKSFLRQLKTGIVRLVLPKACALNEKDAANPDKLAKECPTEYLPGGGSNFSFRKKDYFFPSHSDITIRDNLIFSDTAFSQNIMVRLGDVPLEQISLASEGVRFLNDFIPATVLGDAGKQTALFNKGLQNDKYTFAKGFKITPNTTYALRVVAYRGEVLPQAEFLLSEERRKHTSRYPTNSPLAKSATADIFARETDPLLFSDRREDIIVAFRIVEHAPDGSVTLLWRELRREDSPEITLK